VTVAELNQIARKAGAKVKEAEEMGKP